MNNKIKLKISILLNSIITLLTAVGFFITFTGIKFSKGVEPVLESSKLGVFKFFTVDSNLFMGLVALLFLIEEIKLLKGKINNIDPKLYKLKLMATTAVALTFVVVFAYLGPYSEGGISSMLMNSNLFFHLFIPVNSMITFMFFERGDNLEFKSTFLGLVPTLIYSFFYTLNVIIHINNGIVSPVYDFYWFVQDGIMAMFWVAPLILVVTYLISLLLWRINRFKA